MLKLPNGYINSGISLLKVRMSQWLGNFSIKNILFKNYSRYLKHMIGMHVSVLRQKYDIRTCYALQYSLLYYHIVFSDSCLFRSIILLFCILPFLSPNE